MSEFNHCKILAFANQKGGVGKTTSAVNIAASLGALGKKTLLVDSDPQGNATSGCGVEKRSGKSTYDLIMEENPYECIAKTEFENLEVIPAQISLAGAEIELVDAADRQYRLKKALDTLRGDYDYILIDCPPALGLLTINALSAADGVIVPMQCEYFALEGLSQLMYTISQIKRLYNARLDMVGVVITMFDGRLNLSVQVLEEIKKHFPNKLFRTPVPRNVRLSEAPSFGMPALYFDKHSKGALAYSDIAAELAELCEGENGDARR